jgi:malate synthase
VCRLNLSVGVQYTAAWLNGTGSVPLHNLMEDAATAEISRVQVWQVSGRKNKKLGFTEGLKYGVDCGDASSSCS